MPSSESFPHRPSLSDLEQADAVDIAPAGLPATPGRDQLPIIDVKPTDGRPFLGIHEVQESVVTESRLNQLDSEQRQALALESHRRNHERTKADVLERLKQAVLPEPEEELSREEQSAADGLSLGMEGVFSVEARPGEASRLEREMGAVLQIELIADPEERDAARRKYVAALSERLQAKPEDAEAIYQQLAEQPEIYRALKQQRQVLLLLEHEPERYDEFLQLTRNGDEAAIDAFVASIEDDDLREQLQSLCSEERELTRYIEQRNADRLRRSSNVFQDAVADYDALSETHRLLLGRLVESAAPEFLTLLQNAKLSEDESGLSGQFLARPLRIESDGRTSLGTAEIRQPDASGIRQAAAIDTARLWHCEVFDELPDGKAAVILDPLLQLDRVESLPVASDQTRVAAILVALGLQTAVADGWLILREFQLLDEHGQPDRNGIHRLQLQLKRLSEEPATSAATLDTNLLRRILAFWDNEGNDPRDSTILTASDAQALAETP